jgi:formylglycine-generating enzyme required for sulfatase activity
MPLLRMVVLVTALVLSPAAAFASHTCTSSMRAIDGLTVTLGNANSPINPPRTASVGPFCMDLDEVTIQRYAACVSARQCSAAPLPCARSKLAGLPSHYQDEYPITCVSWHDAQATCRFEGKRLPSQDEWEVAAGGSSHIDRPYNLRGLVTPAQAIAHFQNRALQMTGGDPVDLSFFNISDMAGNVSEWTRLTKG